MIPVIPNAREARIMIATVQGCASGLASIK